MCTELDKGHLLCALMLFTIFLLRGYVALSFGFDIPALVRLVSLRAVIRAAAVSGVCV